MGMLPIPCPRLSGLVGLTGTPVFVVNEALEPNGPAGRNA